jgi:hypothetical protein
VATIHESSGFRAGSVRYSGDEQEATMTREPLGLRTTGIDHGNKSDYFYAGYPQ